MNELTRRIGKFESPEALLSAYESLEKEFTKRCQRLKEAEKANFDMAARTTNEEFLFDCALRGLESGDFIDKHVLANEKIKERVIETYLEGIVRGKTPATISDGRGSAALTPALKPRDLSEAKKLADIIINS